MSKKTRRARKIKSFFRNFNLSARKIILVLVILTVVSVTAVLVGGSFLNKRTVTEQKIYDVAADYYENYLYEKFRVSIGADFETKMSKYGEVGLSRVSLRQLLLHNEALGSGVVEGDESDVGGGDGGKNDEMKRGVISMSEIENIQKYCDTEATYVKFYPEEPFEAKNYHMEINYSCNF